MAQGFAINELDTEKQRGVVYEIEFNRKRGLIDIHKFSAFSEEQEVLIQEGLEYIVESVTPLYVHTDQSATIPVVESEVTGPGATS